jgi:dCMP deaminase
MPRIGTDEYFLKLADVISERSTCKRHHVGAVAVRDKQLLVTGYNGAPTGFPDCLTLGCLRDELRIPSGERTEICRAIHAEQNVIIQAALHGVSIKGAIVYCTHSPCVLCTKMLINAQISKFVYMESYADSAFVDMFKEAKIEVTRYEVEKLDKTT